MAWEKKIICLEQEEGRIEGDSEIIEYITGYYKTLFGHPDRSTVTLNIDNPRTIPRDFVDKMIDEFSFEEIKVAVFGMAHNKSPGPDGFTAEFTSIFGIWLNVTSKPYLMAFTKVNRIYPD